MEKILIEFVKTLDSSFKKRLAESSISGVSQLTIAQVQYIDAIHELKTPTVTEIANKLNLAKASVSTGINKLIAQGYVTKTQSDGDKRVFYLGLTKIGGQSIAAKNQTLKEYGDFISAALSKDSELSARISPIVAIRISKLEMLPLFKSE